MKIRSFELFQVPPRWAFLKIETDEGISGWGEPVIEGRADTVCAAVRELMEYLIGKDPMRIEDHFQVLYRGGFYRGGPILSSAISGIEQALWDIKGKFYNAPIYDLLGGAARDRIRVYSWIGGDRPSDVGLAAQEQVKAGFTAVKMNATEELHFIDSFTKVQAAIERLSAVREAVGPAVGIGVDFHGRVHKAMAKILAKELEPFHPMFIEEPVLPEHNEVLREIASISTIPSATGERMYTRWGFKQLLA
ncbi:MAG: galactonate dehydratase, partial [Bacilli bacterium]|nr:galactonate dehydratase [Bacilli bacterium]